MVRVGLIKVARPCGIIGALPVTISTTIVCSPIARPMPSIIASQYTRSRAGSGAPADGLHSVAPRASEASCKPWSCRERPQKLRRWKVFAIPANSKAPVKAERPVGRARNSRKNWDNHRNPKKPNTTEGDRAKRLLRPMVSGPVCVPGKRFRQCRWR